MVGTLTTPGQLGDVIRQLSTELESVGEAWVILVIFFVVGLGLVYDGFQKWKRMRLIQDTPTEKVRSAAVGRTELDGNCVPCEGTISAPFTDEECLVARYEVEEWEEDDNDDSGGDWKTIESGTRYRPFELDDGTGSMRVEPEDDATFKFGNEHRTRIRVGRRQREPDEVVAFLREHTDQSVPMSGTISGTLFGDKRRYTQEIIPPGEDLYLLGGAHPHEGGSGSNADRLVFGRDEGSDEFIISTLGQDAIISKYKFRAPAQIVGGLAISAFMLFLLVA